MKKIGEGWQYSVYDLENGRVLKKFHPLWKAYWVISMDCFPFTEDAPWKIPGFVRSMKVKGIESFKVIERRNIPMVWMGNPKFLQGLDYEQDKVESLRDAINKRSEEEGKRIVSLFIEFNKKLLDKGIIDKSFNIGKNFGFTKTGEVILIDLGEIFDDPEWIKKQIRNKAWTASYVIGCIKNGGVRAYFLSEMDKNFRI